MTSVPSVHRARVNGATLGQYHAKNVCVVGQITKAEGGGTAFQIKASDGLPINIRLKQPISEPLAGLVEVYGIGQGKNLVLADSFTVLPDNNEFSMSNYNELVTLINIMEDNPLKPM